MLSLVSQCLSSFLSLSSILSLACLDDGFSEMASWLVEIDASIDVVISIIIIVTLIVIGVWSEHILILGCPGTISVRVFASLPSTTVCSATVGHYKGSIVIFTTTTNDPLLAIWVRGISGGVQGCELSILTCGGLWCWFLVRDCRVLDLSTCLDWHRLLVAKLRLWLHVIRSQALAFAYWFTRGYLNVRSWHIRINMRLGHLSWHIASRLHRTLWPTLTVFSLVNPWHDPLIVKLLVQRLHLSEVSTLDLIKVLRLTALWLLPRASTHRNRCLGLYSPTTILDFGWLAAILIHVIAMSPGSLGSLQRSLLWTLCFLDYSLPLFRVTNRLLLSLFVSVLGVLSFL